MTAQPITPILQSIADRWRWSCTAGASSTRVCTCWTPARPTPSPSTGGCRGATGPEGQPGTKGDPGSSVTVASIDPGGACSYGGASFMSGGTTAYACNGAPGTQGAKGESVTTASLEPGSACAYGGAQFTVGGVTSFACNGAPGPQGPQVLPGTGPLTVTDSNGQELGQLISLDPAGFATRAADSYIRRWSLYGQMLPFPLQPRAPEGGSSSRFKVATPATRLRGWLTYSRLSFHLPNSFIHIQDPKVAFSLLDQAAPQRRPRAFLCPATMTGL